MAGTTNRVALYPFRPRRSWNGLVASKRSRSPWTLAGIQSGYSSKKGQPANRSHLATPGGEYSAILTVAGDSWSSETPLSQLTVALTQIELLPENEIL